MDAPDWEVREQVIERPLDFDIPAWMLNRRKDFATGKDMHNNTNKWDFQVKTDIERLIKMRAHRGLRHAWGYKVRSPLMLLLRLPMRLVKHSSSAQHSTRSAGGNWTGWRTYE